MRGVVENLLMEAVRDQLGRRQAGGGTRDNITRNFIRFLTAAFGLTEVESVSKKVIYRNNKTLLLKC